jgi:hypothetical protein
VGAAIGSYWNGTSGSTLIPMIGPNTKRRPHGEVDDARLQKQISFGNGRNLQLMFNAFNIANHQNVTSMNTNAYVLSGGSSTPTTTTGGVTTNNAAYLQGTATYQTNYGLITNTNSQGFLFTPRELEFAVRINF